MFVCVAVCKIYIYTKKLSRLSNMQQRNISHLTILLKDIIEDLHIRVCRVTTLGRVEDSINLRFPSVHRWEELH